MVEQGQGVSFTTAKLGGEIEDSRGLNFYAGTVSPEGIEYSASQLMRIRRPPNSG
jgi:hypothetical protein